MNPRDLPTRWREMAEQQRELGAEAQAKTLEWCAGELDEAVRQVEDELLTVQEAAEETGLAEETLRRRVRNGTLPAQRNSGSGSRIRLRRRDLPTKPGREDRTVVRCGADEYDSEEDARSIARLLEEQR